MTIPPSTAPTAMRVALVASRLVEPAGDMLALAAWANVTEDEG
jgi:hypothetical protein